MLAIIPLMSHSVLKQGRLGIAHPQRRSCADSWRPASSPAVEGGVSPPGHSFDRPSPLAHMRVEPAGRDARLYGRRDACRYELEELKAARSECSSSSISDGLLTV